MTTTNAAYLAIAADLAAILTAVVAVMAYGHYLWRRRCQVARLESYLKTAKEKREDRGQRSLVHLVARVGMTEAEILDASFRSKRIERKISVDGEGKASRVMFVYRERSN